VNRDMSLDNHLRERNLLLGALHNPTVEEFTDLFTRGCDFLCLKDEDAAKVFDASLPNVRRWKRGVVVPPAALMVLGFLRERIELEEYIEAMVVTFALSLKPTLAIYVAIYDLPRFDFQTAVQLGLKITQTTDADFAKLVGVSRPTVTRWKTGKSAPHSILQPNIYTALRKLAVKARK